MNVKELLFENVRGRIKTLLWTEVVKDIDNKEASGGFKNDEARMKYYYERANYWYEKYEPLLKKMEGDK
jgi:hypothetical protein